MTDIRIERVGTTYDLVLADDGDLDLVTDRLELAAHLALYRVLTWSAESVYDRSVGIPYLDGVFGKQPLEAVGVLFVEELRGTPGVDEVLDPIFDLDPNTRQLTASARLRVGQQTTTIGATVIG